MQQNQERFIIGRIVIGYHEFQSIIGKPINREYVANLQSCPKFLGNLEIKFCYWLLRHLKKKDYFFSVYGLTVVILLFMCKKLILSLIM